MGKTDNEIRELLARFIGENKPTMIGKVIAVDKTENTCTVDDDGTDWYDVQLRVVTGPNTGVIAYPAIGAYVLCIKIENTENWAVLSATHYSGVELTIDSLVLNGGELGGLIKIVPLTTALNELKDTLNSLVQKFNSHIHTTTATVGASAVLGTLSAPTSAAETAQEFDKSDYEDLKFKH